MSKDHSDAYYAARNHYQEVSERAGAGKGGSYRRVDKKKYDPEFERIFGKKLYWWEKRKK